MPRKLTSKRSIIAVSASTTAFLLLLITSTAAVGHLSGVNALEIGVAVQPTLPISSPSALVGVDTGTNQAYVRSIAVDVQQGILQGASATIYFPATGYKVFIVEFYAFDNNGNQVDYSVTIGASSANTYDALVSFQGGVQIINVEQVEVRVTCVLGC